VLGAASEVRRTDERTVILDVLKEAEEPMAPIDIAGAIGQPSDNVKELLFKMVKDGQVAKLRGRGCYVHPDRNDLSDTPKNHVTSITR
jgi:hypothetical protein